MRKINIPGYLRFLAKRAIFLLLTLMIATYLTIIIANFGGYIDEILKSQIEWEVSWELSRDPAFRKLPEEEQERIRLRMIEDRIKARGLDKPFILRSIIYLRDALTLSLGRAMYLRSAGGSSRVADIILERLPWSVLLFTTGTILSALVGIYVGLYMAKRALGVFDRSMMVTAILTSSIPAWFFGIIFLLVFSIQLGIFPPGGLVSRPHTELFAYIIDVLYHLALPLITWVFASFGGWAYVTRNIVIQIMREDFVMAARAKGLPERRILYKYVLRPAAPPIVTMLALAIIASWTGAIITETVFSWPGLGTLYWEAIGVMDAPVIIGLTVIYAYLYVITIFILDLVYALLDPRVRTLGG